MYIISIENKFYFPKGISTVCNSKLLNLTVGKPKTCVSRQQMCPFSQPPTPVLKRERLQRVIGNTGSDMKATFSSWMLTQYTIKLTIIIYNDDDTQILIIIPISPAVNIYVTRRIQLCHTGSSYVSVDDTRISAPRRHESPGA